MTQRRAARKSPGRFHHGALADALECLACELVDREGHEQVSTKRLARELGVTEPAIYRHFASKQGLLAVVVLGWYVELDRRISEAVEMAAGDPAAAVSAAGRAYVRAALAYRHRFRMTNSREWNEELQQLDALRRSRWTGRGRTVLREAIADLVGVPRDVVADVWRHDVPVVDDVYRAAWAMAHGLAVLVVERGFVLARDDDERVRAADAAIGEFEQMLRARWPR